MWKMVAFNQTNKIFNSSSKIKFWDHRLSKPDGRSCNWIERDASLSWKVCQWTDTSSRKGY